MQEFWIGEMIDDRRFWLISWLIKTADDNEDKNDNDNNGDDIDYDEDNYNYGDHDDDDNLMMKMICIRDFQIQRSCRLVYLTLCHLFSIPSTKPPSRADTLAVPGSFPGKVL